MTILAKIPLEIKAIPKTCQPHRTGDGWNASLLYTNSIKFVVFEPVHIPPIGTIEPVKLLKKW
jgi:hypothetical protein